MPYIKQERRKALFNDSNNDWNSNVENAGELNYYISTIILDYLKHKGANYQTMNDIVGALDNVKDEFRRRVQHPYEDVKIKENGDL